MLTSCNDITNNISNPNNSIGSASKVANDNTDNSKVSLSDSDSDSFSIQISNYCNETLTKKFERSSDTVIDNEFDLYIKDIKEKYNKTENIKFVVELYCLEPFLDYDSYCSFQYNFFNKPFDKKQ